MTTPCIYTCDHCGKAAPWSNGWYRWSSLRTEEDGEEVFACSPACRDRMPDPDAVFRRKFGHSANRRRSRYS